MKFLVDHQLPPALVDFLRSLGHEAQHVRDSGLESDDDSAIWQHAVKHKFILISKDEDFFHLANRPDETGKLVWIRLGNCRNYALFAALKAALPKILNSVEENYRIIELR